MAISDGADDKERSQRRRVQAGQARDAEEHGDRGKSGATQRADIHEQQENGEDSEIGLRIGRVQPHRGEGMRPDDEQRCGRETRPGVGQQLGGQAERRPNEEGDDGL